MEKVIDIMTKASCQPLLWTVKISTWYLKGLRSVNYNKSVKEFKDSNKTKLFYNFFANFEG